MAAKSKKSDLWGFSTNSLLMKQLHMTRKGGLKSARVHVEVNKRAPAVRTLEGEKGIEIFLNPLAAPENEIDARLKTPATVRVRDSVGASVAMLEKMEA